MCTLSFFVKCLQIYLLNLVIPPLYIGLLKYLLKFVKKNFFFGGGECLHSLLPLSIFIIYYWRPSDQSNVLYRRSSGCRQTESSSTCDRYRHLPKYRLFRVFFTLQSLYLSHELCYHLAFIMRANRTTKVAQVLIAVHRDFKSCTHRLTSEP